MSNISELKARLEELEREKLQKRVCELEAELRKKQAKQKKIVPRRIDLSIAAALLIILCVCGIAYLGRDEVSSLATRIGLPGAPASTTQVTPTMVFIGGCSATELQSPQAQTYLAAVDEELANTDPGRIEVFLVAVQTAFDDLPDCVRNYVEPFNTPLNLGFKAAAQARDEVDPAKMQNYKDIFADHMQAVVANISFFNGLRIAYTNPRLVKGPTPTTDPDSPPPTGSDSTAPTDPDSKPPTGPGSQAGGTGSTLKILDPNTINQLGACYSSGRSDLTAEKKSVVYSQSLVAAGGSPFKGYTWSAKNLPMGTTIWPQTGVFMSNGGALNPDMPEMMVEVTVSDGTSSVSAMLPFKIYIDTSEVGCPSPVFLNWGGVPGTALEEAVANKPYGDSLYITGGTPPYSWVEDTSFSGRGDFDLSGLTIDMNSGVVSGTPFESASGKTLRFRVIVKDSLGLDTNGVEPIFTITVK